MNRNETLKRIEKVEQEIVFFAEELEKNRNKLKDLLKERRELYDLLKIKIKNE